ncbi:MAG: protein kinase, partial [Planctomycetaceae bacterium]
MTSESDDIVLSLANEFVERYRRGERPDVSEYANQHPELAAEIRDVFPMMLLMEDNAPEEPKPVDTSLDVDRLGDFLIHREIGRGGMGVVYEAVQESLGRDVALKVCPLSSKLDSRHQERFRRESRAAAMLHHTNIVPVFAVGEENGMLFYAMQYIRGATVEEVIVELRHMYKTNPTANSRLTGVSRPTHSAQHNAVSEVALSLVGEVDPSLPASSGFKADSAISEISLPGQSVTDSQSGRTAKYWDSVARIGVQVADALNYAHEQGTLHRDIKPSNLMLDHTGTVWVMDFGLAKSTEEQDLTQAGELIGTLRYMSPEQSTGNPDARSDIYSLGLTLYELLALRPAFEEVQRSALLRAISESDPINPRKINPNVPRDLETIVMKASDKEPSRRYQTAAELQNDLTRFLQGEPILARPVSSTERLGKWIRRRPIIAGLGAALVTTFCVAFALVSYNWFRAESALDTAEANERQAKAAALAEADALKQAERQRTLAEERLEVADAALYRGGISRAGMLSQTDPQESQKILAGLVPQKGEVDRRGWEWGYLNGLVNQSSAVLNAGTEDAPWIWAIEFSKDDSLVAIGSGRTQFVRPGSPPGRLTIWDVRSAKLIRELKVSNTVYALAFSSDNKRVAVSEPSGFGTTCYNWSGPATIRDLESGDTISLELTDRERVAKLAFVAQDSLVVGAVRITPYQSPIAIKAWDAQTGKVVWSGGQPWVTPKGEVRPEKYETCFELHEVSEDGESIVVSTFEDTGPTTGNRQVSRLTRINVRDEPTNGSSLPPLEYLTEEFDPYRAVFASAIGMCADNHSDCLILREFASDRVHKLWGDDQYRVFLRNDSRPIATFHPDMGSLVAGAMDGSLRLWDLHGKSLKRILRGHQAPVLTVTYSHDGRWLATGDWNGEVRLWQPEAPTHHVVCDQGARRNGKPASEAVAFRWDGAAVVRFENGRLQTWDAEGGNPLQTVAVAHGPMVDRRRDSCFDKSGEKLLLPGEDNCLQLIDVESQRVLWTSPAFESFPTGLALSADGNHVAMSHVDGTKTTLSVFNIEPNQSWQHDIEGVSATSIAIAADGSKLAVGLGPQGNGTLCPGSGTRQESRPFAGGSAESLDDFRYDVGRGGVLVFDLASPSTVGRTPETFIAKSLVGTMQFSDDASVLAVATDGGQIAIIDTDSMELLAEGIAPEQIRDLAWHPLSTRIAGANREVVTVWDTKLREVTELKTRPRSDDLPFEPDVTFSPDGSKLAAIQWNNTVNIWSADSFAIASAPGTRRPTRDELASRSVGVAVDRQPENPWYRLARGQIRSRLRAKKLAREDYAAAKRQLSDDKDCLLLHGGAYIEAPTIPFHEFDGYTIECWVRNWSTHETAFDNAPIASQHPTFPWTARIDRHAFWNRYLRLGIRLPSKPATSKTADWTHYAATDDGRTFRLFLNGRQVRVEYDESDFRNLFDGKNTPEGQPFLIGNSWVEPNIAAHGLMRALRVSNRAVYTQDFEPPKELVVRPAMSWLVDRWVSPS